MTIKGADLLSTADPYRPVYDRFRIKKTQVDKGGATKRWRTDARFLAMHVIWRSSTLMVGVNLSGGEL